MSVLVFPSSLFLISIPPFADENKGKLSSGYVEMTDFNEALDVAVTDVFRKDSDELSDFSTKREEKNKTFI